MEQMMRWFPVLAVWQVVVGSPLSTTTCNYTTGNVIMRVCKQDNLAICLHVQMCYLFVWGEQKGCSKVDLIISISKWLSGILI